METAQNLKEALIESRNQHTGITLEYIGRIIKEVLDDAEVRALIIELQQEKIFFAMDDDSDEVAEERSNEDFNQIQDQQRHE